MNRFGYETAEPLPPIATIDDYVKACGQPADTTKVEAALEAASQAIRDWCGWHVYPSVACTAQVIADGRFLRLPALVVTEVTGVTEDGEELSEGQYEWRRDGLVRRCGFRNWSQSWNGVGVAYVAGISDQDAAAVRDACVTLAANASTAPRGISSESAGDVSISYSVPGGGIDVASNAGLRAVLAWYRLPRSV